MSYSVTFNKAFPNRYIIYLKIVDVRLRAIIDTACSTTLVPLNWAKMYGKPSEIMQSVTVGGHTYQATLYRLDNVKIGDFVEIKKTFVGKNSKIPHLSYIGDCTIGENVNVGAGTITCNYDGKNKWQTVLEDGSFIGSNTNLVAPVTVGKDAVIGAGSTITQDVPGEALAVARQKQKNISDWASGKKK